MVQSKIDFLKDQLFHYAELLEYEKHLKEHLGYQLWLNHIEDIREELKMQLTKASLEDIKFFQGRYQAFGEVSSFFDNIRKCKERDIKRLALLVDTKKKDMENARR